MDKGNVRARSARIGRFWKRQCFAVIGAGFIAISSSAFGAELDVNYSGVIGSRSAAAPTFRQLQVRVQPRAWEFAPPYGKPDLSPENARTVDRLYDELMRGSRPNCSPASINSAERGRC